jgi:hypothetical protein
MGTGCLQPLSPTWRCTKLPIFNFPPPDAYGRTSINDSDYTPGRNDNFIAYTALTETRTITLPAAGTIPPGKAYIIVDESGNCSDTVSISIVGPIMGGTSASIEIAYGVVVLVSNGVDMWFISGSSGVVY